MKKKPTRPDNLRPLPWFMEFGGDMLNYEAVRLMSMGERGLLATMRWCIWANDTLPADPAQLARLLGLREEDVRSNLSEGVLSFFEPAKGYDGRLIEPELARQKKAGLERRQRHVDAANATNEKRWGPKADA